MVTDVLERLYPQQMAMYPRPPEPIAPAMAVSPTREIKVTVDTRTNSGVLRQDKP